MVVSDFEVEGRISCILHQTRLLLKMFTGVRAMAGSGQICRNSPSPVSSSAGRLNSVLWFWNPGKSEPKVKLTVWHSAVKTMPSTSWSKDF